MQYPHAVHGIGHNSSYFCRTRSTSASSSVLSSPTPDRPALATFSTTCSIALIPDSTTETSGLFHSHCSAHSTGILG